ncbi:MAG TPA: hypothetical protein VFZ66_20655 [Herpetosiphonaceae bacterium]
MTTLTITLPEDQLAKLQELASRLQVTPEELATTSIEELLTRPDATFQQAVSYVLKKNADLYRRLS